MASESQHATRDQAPLFMHEMLSTLDTGATVLDLGSGSGSFDYADFPHLSIHAVDRFTPENLNKFPRHVDFCLSSAEELPYGDSTFDVVIANFVFEDVADFASVIREADRVVKEGGFLHMSVPNSTGFEDDLYRTTFEGGGHLQRLTFESTLHQVYSNTRFKLVCYADWPAGFTFLEDKDTLRRFILSVAESVRRASGLDMRARCNYIFLFRREKSLGYRHIERVCTYCGAGSSADDNVSPKDASWRCPACGRANSWRDLSREDIESLEEEIREVWKRHAPRPHVYPEASSSDADLFIHPYDLEELKFIAYASRRVRNSRFFSLAGKLLAKIL